LAEWWRRAVAILIDAVIVGIPVGILGAVLGLADVVHEKTAQGQSVRYEGRPGLYLLSFLVSLAYFGMLEGGERGASVGKMALRIRIVDASTGGTIGVGRAVLRRFVYLVLFYALFLPGLINVLSPLWDARRQAWHDKAANSLVVNTA
jgi:uncharacterized RDD family membrane protein YckC